MNADRGGQGGRKLLLEVEGGGSVRAPATPVLEGFGGNAEGHQGSSAAAAEAVEGESGATR